MGAGSGKIAHNPTLTIPIQSRRISNVTGCSLAVLRSTSTFATRLPDGPAFKVRDQPSTSDSSATATTFMVSSRLVRSGAVLESCEYNQSSQTSVEHDIRAP